LGSEKLMLIVPFAWPSTEIWPYSESWSSSSRAGARADALGGGTAGLLVHEVREVVRDLVLPDLLGEHARGGDVDPAVHSSAVIGSDAPFCSGMEPVVRIKTMLLRTQLPEVTLRPGVSVVARVLSRGEHHGVLVIAGVPLSAQLPPEIGRTGETLRLSVTDVTPERVTMQLDQVINPAAQPPPPVACKTGCAQGSGARRRPRRPSARAGGTEDLWTAVAEALAWAYSVTDAAITSNR
jgi:hypothetical protein